MKTKYSKVLNCWSNRPGDYFYVWNGRGYHRAVKTFSEIRQNEATRADLRGVHHTAHPRGRRSRYELDAWNDFKRDRTYGKSWKHYTRHRKQWMVREDPKATPYRYVDGTIDTRGLVNHLGW
jgi:hypothetical protein